MSERLRHSRDVKAVLARGHAMRRTHVVIRSLSRDDHGPPRWTVSASRRVGSAVRRNRAKRRLRAVVRDLDLPGGNDLVIIARESAASCPFSELVADGRALEARVDQCSGGGASR